jgi:phage gp36-like protein
MSQPLAIELAASAARTADGSGTAVDLGLVGNTTPRSAARLTFEVTAFSDLERLRLAVETAPAETGPWLELDAVDAEQTGEYELSVGDTKRWIRLRWELVGSGGSASVTFSADGTAHQSYIGPRDLGRYGIRRQVIDERIELATQADACITVSDEADGYLGGRYTLPMLSWSEDLKAHCARMAIKYGLDTCGRQVEEPEDQVERGFDRAIAWLKRLQAGQLEPPGMKDSTPETFEGGSVVVSRPRRSVI